MARQADGPESKRAAAHPPARMLDIPSGAPTPRMPAARRNRFPADCTAAKSAAQNLEAIMMDIRR